MLVVEDDVRIADLVRDYLEASGFAVRTSATGATALRGVVRHEPDLVLLDLGLPDMDGLDVLRTIRGTSEVPVVILSARSDETDSVVGLELGADDYVIKPFRPKELVARVRAQIRRASRATSPEIIEIGDLLADLAKMRVTVADRDVELTATEFRLVSTLASSAGRVFTRGQLLDAVHGVSFDSYERAIDAHVKNIRRKIEDDPRRPRYLLTVHGVGYRFADA